MAVPEIVILQYRLLQYRVPLFERLRAACDARGLRLRLVHGQPSAAEAIRRDTANLPWAHVVRNHFCAVGGKDLLWQPFPAALRRARLVVMMQESRILSNYPWLFAPGSARVAFWGHGRNFQSMAPDGLRERWKASLRNRVDWWFAYTELSGRIVADGGYPGDRITVLDNAIDNDGFANDLAAATAEKVATLRARIGAEPGAPVGLYCGSLYPDKRLDLLVQAARLVQRARPDFRLVVLGDGPSRPVIEEAARTLPWLHWAGMQRGVDKAAWFRASDYYLSPGAVGLHVLDAFCAGLPMITTDSALHGPEVAYLDSGRNGFIVPADAADYAATCLRLIEDADLRNRLRRAAHADAQRYTMDNMVRRFMGGMQACLAAPRRA